MFMELGSGVPWATSHVAISLSVYPNSFTVMVRMTAGIGPMKTTVVRG